MNDPDIPEIESISIRFRGRCQNCNKLFHYSTKIKKNDLAYRVRQIDWNCVTCHAANIDDIAIGIGIYHPRSSIVNYVNMTP